MKNTEQDAISYHLPAHRRGNIKAENTPMASSFTHIMCLRLLYGLMLIQLAFTPNTFLTQMLKD